MRLGVISDTHIPNRARLVPAAVFDAFREVDIVLHAGDLVEKSVLDELSAIAPVQAVLGNCDVDPALRSELRETLLLDAGLGIGVIHDSGPASGRRERLRAKFPDARVVVFGHSHQPMVEDDGDLLLLNPGSACDPRWAKVPTVAVLEITNKGPEARLIQLKV